MLESGGQRLKLAQASFTRAGARGLQLHPLLVWDAVRCGGASRQQLAAGLPRHMQRELAAILDALTEEYCAVQEAVVEAASPGAPTPQGSACRRRCPKSKGHVARVKLVRRLHVLFHLNAALSDNSGPWLQRGTAQLCSSSWP